MIYSVDGNIIEIDNNVFERKIKTLTYQIKGSWFPQANINGANDTNNYTGNEFLWFVSTQPNSVSINYGDGNTVIKQFELDGSIYKVGFSFRAVHSSAPWRVPQHTYIDGFTGIRNITFEFESPEYIRDIEFSFILLRGALPIETVYFPNLEKVSHFYAKYIDNIPNSFPPKINYYQIGSSVISPQPQIPDSLFETDISFLSIYGAYDLTDNIASNFFKINQLKDTLTTLDLSSSDITSLPESFAECVNLKSFTCPGNDFNAFPLELNFIENLETLNIGNSNYTLLDTTFPVLDNLKNLKVLYCGFRNIDVTQLHISWKYLYSLSTLGSSGLFARLVNTNARFDDFIDSFYTLCTNEGSITNNSGQFPTYPNRFRNIAWGNSSLSFTGTKQAPIGYIQGGSGGGSANNGTPANQGEKVYVLQNQYGHTITHA